MDKIKDIILRLDKSEEDWRTYIKMNDDSKAADVSELRRNILNLLLALREVSKMNNQHETEKVRELINDDMLSDNLFKNVEATLVHYKALEPVRQLEREDLPLCKEFFGDVIANYVIRWDRKLHLSFKKYHFADSSDMKSAMESIDSLTDYYVGNTFINSSIVEDFAEESGLSECTCGLYAELVDTYFKDIKLNIIFNNVASLMERMEKIEAALTKKD